MTAASNIHNPYLLDATLLSATHHDHYAPNDAGTDGQSAYFGAPVRSLPSDLFRGLTVSRNPELRQSLPAEKQHELENSLEFKTLENQLETLSLSGKYDLGTKILRRELYAQKSSASAQTPAEGASIQERRV
jgi:hypothetical protein